MRTIRPTEAETAGRKADPARIVNAAVSCIERNGTHKTSITDIALEAGVGRQTVYRTFPNRTLLLEAVATRRLGAIAKKAKLIVSKYKSFEEALIFGSIELVETARKDPIYLAVLNELHNFEVERYLISPSSPLRDYMTLIWSDTLETARKRKELRSDLSDIEILEWLRGVILIIFLREELTSSDVQKLLRTFVLPALQPGFTGGGTRYPTTARRTPGKHAKYKPR